MNSSNSDSAIIAERYAVLLDLARALTTTVAPAALYAAVSAHVRRALPGSSVAVAVSEDGWDLEPVYDEGEGTDWRTFCREAVDQLRVGGTVFRGGEGVEPRVLAVSLLNRESFLGCLAVSRPADRERFSEIDAELLQAIGRLAGLALHNGWLATRAQRRSQEIEQLATAVRDLSASLELESVVERVATHAHQWTSTPVIVWLTEGERARAVARAGGAHIRIGEERPLPSGLATRVLERVDSPKLAEPPGDARAGVVLGDGGDPLLHDREWFGAGEGDAGRISVPLVLGRHFIGFLAIGPWDRPADHDRIRLLLRMAPHAAAAIENARLHAELRRLSLTDPLVQLPNRRQLDLVLEREFAAAVRGRSVCFILFDLDRFKEYNDAFGHREGDNALIRFSQILRAETRSMNLPARYGGEEFAAVLSGTGRLGGQYHAERVRRRVLREFDGRLTVSAGVAEFRPGMTSPNDLVVAADRALYRAKMTGRNRVCMADEASSGVEPSFGRS